MEEEIRRYTIGDGRLKRSWLEQMTMIGRGALAIPDSHGVRRAFLCRLDGIRADNHWGRLHLDLRLPANGICTVYAVADNQWERMDHYLSSSEVSTEKKAQFFRESGVELGTNTRDMLLYRLAGRYLYVYIEVLGEGKGWLGNLFVENPGDHFMQAFPEVYQEPNGFFHRYLSIFSTLYQDMQRQIDTSHMLLDKNSITLEMQNLYMQWLGYPDGYVRLSVGEQRKLLKSLYWLNRRKGTRAAAEKLAEILRPGQITMTEQGRHTLLVMIKETRSKELPEKILCLLPKFLPAETRIQLAFLDELPRCSGTICLDVNARIIGLSSACLNQQAELGRCVMD